MNCNNIERNIVQNNNNIVQCNITSKVMDHVIS